MKRTIAFFLVLMMCLPLIVACQKTVESTPVDSDTTMSDVPSTPVILNGSSEYVIVYSVSTENKMTGLYQDMATLLQGKIKELTGAELSVVSEDTAPADKEIVVGKTSRSGEAASPVSIDAYKLGFSIFRSGEKILLEAGSQVGLRLAIYTLLEDLLGVDLLFDVDAKVEEGMKEFSLSENYEVAETFTSEKLPYFGVSADKIGICYGDGYVQQRASVLLQNELNAIEKVKPERVTHSNAKAGTVYFWLQTDNTVQDGGFRLSASGQKILVSAKDYYGFAAAIKAIAKLRRSLGFYPFGEKRTAEGSHVDYLPTADATAKYAFDRSEYRVMFYNVLWDDLALQERAILQTEVVEVYRPDVIGFQEFDERRRTDMVPILQDLGYAETMNYKQGNFVSGSSGATKTNLYSCVPIFYNTATTKCIANGFYRYAAQYSVGESKSKTLSWAVMESKVSGEKYIVVNTHMCTQDDEIKGKQAKEAVNVIDNILKTYDFPVFLGGDYNGNYNNANFKYFGGDGGFTDVEKNNMAEEFTSKLKSYHRPYPVFNDTYGLMWAGAEDDSGAKTPEVSVDHIMVKNDYPVTIDVYGVVVDDYTISGGDHFPIFVDFSIG